MHGPRRLGAVGARVSGARGRADAGGAGAGPLDRSSVQLGPLPIASPRFHQSPQRARPVSHEQAEQAVALATDHGFGAVRSWRRTSTGAGLLAEEGRAEDGLAAHASVGRRLPADPSRNACSPPTGRGWPRRMAGSGDGRDGTASRGGGTRRGGRGSGNHYWTAELYRVRGALAESEKDAESSFVEAIAIARRQRAKSFELRAATQPEPAVGPPGEDAGSPRAARRDPCLVHRRA